MAKALYNKKLPKGKPAGSIAKKMRGHAKKMTRAFSGKMDKM